MDTKVPSALQLKILRKILSQEELDAIMDKYNKNKRSNGWGLTRMEALSVPLTEGEVAFLKEYVGDSMSVSIKNIGNKFLPTVNPKSLYSKLCNIGLRYLYQHQIEIKFNK